MRSETAKPGEKGAQAPAAPSPAASYAYRFYLSRYRFYLGLLLFTLLVGTPLLVVPRLRARLFTRAATLKAAASGRSNTLPVSSAVGQNREPFPVEFERPVAPKPQPPKLPSFTGLIDFTQGAPKVATGPSLRTPRPAGEPARAATAAPAAAPAAPPVAEGEAGAPSDEPQYSQGKVEKDAYDLLLETSAAIKAIAGASNPSYSLKSWGAAKRDEDTFWVKLTLVSQPGGVEGDYIWEVRLAAKQVSPLNFNARMLPR